jgi:hypothetical protein
MRMLDLRIVFGAIVACISIIAIGVGLVLTNEALNVARNDRPDIRINVGSRTKQPTATTSLPAPVEQSSRRATEIPAAKRAVLPPAAEPATPAAAKTATIPPPAEPALPTRPAARTAFTPAVIDPPDPPTRVRAEPPAPPPVRHATRPAAPAPQADLAARAAAGALEAPPDVTGVIGRAMPVDIPKANPRANSMAARRSADDETIFPLFRMFVPPPIEVR